MKMVFGDLKMDLNVEMLKDVMGLEFEVREGGDMGFVNIEFERDLKKEEVVKLSKSGWLKGVKVWNMDDEEKEFVCCWGGGNVLCDNEIGLNLKEDEEDCLGMEENLYGYESFEEYWEDVKGKIVGLDRYEMFVEVL